jgi:hypothetical protein
MYYRDHAPPHFHAICGDHEGVVDLRTGALLAGHLPARSLSIVRKWARIRRSDLARNWRRTQAGEPLETIDPLE